MSNTAKALGEKQNRKSFVGFDKASADWFQSLSAQCIMIATPFAVANEVIMDAILDAILHLEPFISTKQADKESVTHTTVLPSIYRSNACSARNKATNSAFNEENDPSTVVSNPRDRDFSSEVALTSIWVIQFSGSKPRKDSTSVSMKLTSWKKESGSCPFFSLSGRTKAAPTPISEASEKSQTVSSGSTSVASTG